MVVDDEIRIARRPTAPSHRPRNWCRQLRSPPKRQIPPVLQQATHPGKCIHAIALSTNTRTSSQTAVHAPNCYSSERFGTRLVQIDDSNSTVIELEPDREVRLETKFGGAAAWHYDFYKRDRTIQIYVRSGVVVRICRDQIDGGLRKRWLVQFNSSYTDLGDKPYCGSAGSSIRTTNAIRSIASFSLSLEVCDKASTRGPWPGLPRGKPGGGSGRISRAQPRVQCAAARARRSI